MSNTILIYNGTPEQTAAAQTLWEKATFPRGFLEGHQAKLYFTANVGSAYTARAGSIVITDRATPSSVGPIVLHEIGHLADFWCLTPADRLEILDLLGSDMWRYYGDEIWSHSFAHAYIPPGQTYPTYPVPADVVRKMMDRCGPGVPDEPTFSDVPTDHPYFEAIEWAAANGITIGKGPGIYGPDDKVTRAQMALFLQRAAGA